MRRYVIDLLISYLIFVLDLWAWCVVVVVVCGCGVVKLGFWFGTCRAWSEVWTPWLAQQFLTERDMEISKMILWWWNRLMWWSWMQSSGGSWTVVVAYPLRWEMQSSHLRSSSDLVSIHLPRSGVAGCAKWWMRSGSMDSGWVSRMDCELGTDFGMSKSWGRFRPVSDSLRCWSKRLVEVGGYSGCCCSCVSGVEVLLPWVWTD